jgi:titin
MKHRSWDRNLALFALFLMFVRSISAATFVVTTNSDSGSGSLRQAIIAANSLPGRDSITFNIPGSGVQTISPATALPSIDDSLGIDGTTQPGFSGKPRIVISGSRGALTYGLVIAADNCGIKGLSVSACVGTGIIVTRSSNVISGCFIGTDAEGSASRANGIGILFQQGSTGNLIGGTSVSERNVISGNRDLGVCFLFANGNTIQGNFIGTDATGGIALANGNDGVSVDHSSNCNVGGSLAGEGNLISGNGRSGIRIIGPPASGNVIQGNMLGVDGNGSSFLANQGDGITVLNAAENTIGGTETGAGNLVSGNGGNGIIIQDFGATGNVIEGNVVGLDASGSRLLPNFLNGVQVANASETTIGGIEPGAGNIISGNRLYGISLFGSNDVVQGNFVGTDLAGNFARPNGLDAVSGGGVLIQGSHESVGGESASARNVISGNHHDGVRLEQARECVVQANWIGVDIFGGPLGNAVNGISLNGSGSRGNTIGGSEPGTGNVCSGNGLAGILLSGSAQDNVVLGNWIGTHPAAAGPLGNGGAGIEVADASNDQIGGPGAGEGNRIVFNHGNGVLVRGNGAVGITISGNAIFANNGHAINLQPTGEKPNVITPNDELDEDGGPNHLQNAPVITNIVYFLGQTIISGFLRSKEDSQYSIEFFRNDSYSGYAFGEGQTYVGAATLSTDANGFGQFQVPLPGDFGSQLFAATAQDLDTGDTSEFSAAVPVLKGVLRITEVRHSGATDFISFTTETNTQYRLEQNGALPATAWIGVSGATSVSGTGNVITVTNESPHPRNFYRVVRLP